MRVGLGYDIHRLVSGLPLVLGGVDIPFDKGLSGHSDGDALIHAMMDALLGAAGLQDIGHYFPNSDPQYKGISSLILLRRVKETLDSRRASIVNLDTTILAQAPQLAPYMEEMKQKLSQALGIRLEQIGIKATTAEGVGFVGRKEGIAAMAVALVET